MFFREYGVAVYAKERLAIRRRTFGNCAIEVICFQWSACSVVALYKSPANSCPLQRLLELLEETLVGLATELGTAEGNILIVGDFNVDLAKHDTAACRQLVLWMMSRGLRHVDVGATTDLVSKIDQIWANFDLGQPTQTLDCYYSDHKQLLVSMPDSFQHL